MLNHMGIYLRIYDSISTTIPEPINTLYRLSKESRETAGLVQMETIAPRGSGQPVT